MIGDEKNLKDGDESRSLALKDIGISISYNKTNKLISALYMVTDILDKAEPIRGKLRDLGLQVISDVTTNLSQVERTIFEILSLLDIASTIGLISSMNTNILKKEFWELDKSIKSFKNPGGKTLSIEELLWESPQEISKPSFEIYEPHPIGQNINAHKGTRIGVQRGGTLLKVLSDRTALQNKSDVLDFNLIKKQRREDITKILKGKPEGMTITMLSNEIKDKKVSSLLSSGEKTLQRELVSMVKDGVLKKIGEKRWSRYLL